MARRIKNLATAARMAELFPVPGDPSAPSPEPAVAAQTDTEAAAGYRERYEFPEPAGPELKRQALRLRVTWAATASVIVLALVIGAGVLWLGAGTGFGEAAPSLVEQPVPAVAISAQGRNRTTSGSETGPVGSGQDTGNLLIVHIAGSVAKPGIVRMAPGSRLFEALEAAGGALPDAALATVNLAAELQDGMQVLVPRAAEAAANPQAAVPSAPGGAALSRPGPVNLNRASIEELLALPRIGPVTAQRILEWRAANGRFRSVDDLAAVDGIGMKTLESLRSLLVV